jgi:hypothetical protein
VGFAGEDLILQIQTTCVVVVIKLNGSGSGTSTSLALVRVVAERGRGRFVVCIRARNVETHVFGRVCSLTTTNLHVARSLSASDDFGISSLLCTKTLIAFKMFGLTQV